MSIFRPMKRNIFTIIFILSAVSTFAQNRIGIELGAGKPTFAYGSYSSVDLPAINTDILFTANAYYLRKVARHLYVGAKASFEQYGFDFEKTQSDGAGGTSGTNVLHKSAYLHFGPMVDAGIGRHREYLHVYAFSTLGFLTTGYQFTRDYYRAQNPVLDYDNTSSSGFKQNSLIVRVGFGLKQQFPLAKMWYFTINEGFSFMPFGDLTQPDAAGGSNLHPGYLTLQMGFMHKFRDHRASGNDK